MSRNFKPAKARCSGRGPDWLRLARWACRSFGPARAWQLRFQVVKMIEVLEDPACDFRGLFASVVKFASDVRQAADECDLPAPAKWDRSEPKAISVLEYFTAKVVEEIVAPAILPNPYSDIAELVVAKARGSGAKPRGGGPARIPAEYCQRSHHGSRHAGIRSDRCGKCVSQRRRRRRHWLSLRSAEATGRASRSFWPGGSVRDPVGRREKGDVGRDVEDRKGRVRRWSGAAVAFGCGFRGFAAGFDEFPDFFQGFLVDLHVADTMTIS